MGKVRDRLLDREKESKVFDVREIISPARKREIAETMIREMFSGESFFFALERVNKELKLEGLEREWVKANSDAFEETQDNMKELARKLAHAFEVGG